MKIIVLSPRNKYPHESEIITKLFEKGLGAYHLRKPFLRFSTMVNLLKAIPEKYHAKIIIHSHHKLIRKFNLAGLHYTGIHLEPTFINWWNNKILASYLKNKTKTSSCKKLADLYAENDMVFNYVFLTPVFDPITGKYQSGFYEDSLKIALQKNHRKVIAMGGIDITKIEKVNELGFYGLALYSCMWEKEHPVAEYDKIIERCKELSMPIE